MQTRNFAEILRALADVNQPFTAALTYGLSGLDRQQLAELERRWPHYPVERRRNLLQHLNAASEHNFELDFRDINHIALADADSEVRQYAIEGLWEDESPALMHKLIHSAQSDPSPEVRAAALIELGRFILLGEYEDIPAEDARLAQDTVLDILRTEEDTEIHRRALEAIANCGREGVHELVREAYEHEDLKMRISAVFAMGRTCDTVWAPEVLREIDSEVPEMRYEAVRAAGQLELKEAIPHLARLIDETEDIEILEIAIWALGEIGGEKAQKLLTRIMARAEAEGNEEILQAAEEAYHMADLPGDFLLFDFEP